MLCGVKAYATVAVMNEPAFGSPNGRGYLCNFQNVMMFASSCSWSGLCNSHMFVVVALPSMATSITVHTCAWQACSTQAAL
jgi:hypothetical protein